MSKSLAPELLAELTEQGFTLGSVESLTAGLFGARFCEVPGASKAYLGGLITYDPKEKIALAHVPAKTIAQYGVVSTEVAKAMAEGGSRALQVDLCVAVTGNAGPTTCPGYAKVGDVDIGIAFKNRTYTFPCHFEGTRNEIREQAVEVMMDSCLFVLRGPKN
ncbi:MAG: putative competence-damage inducible protein [Tenericutes bacterium ADurb.BinA155]|jgi:nicotinamide-nucleotide amidase|nr:MAG: putative competence-damage inducible protein [Tenericutes bacterium ADurb.BinA155]